MMTTMLGFLAAVCADAGPPNASGNARAVVMRSCLNINVSFIIAKFRTNQSTDRQFLRRKNRANEQRQRAREEMIDRSTP
jgi:hypothetical protein